MAANRPELQCPSCGAPLPIRSPASLQAVCAYCHAVVYWNEQGIQDAGRKSHLIEGFTRLYRGATGTLRMERLDVLGRIRYGYGGGFWDEWYVTIGHGRTAWITEDDHELAVQSPYEGDVSAALGLSPGGRFVLDDTSFEVGEVGEAECVGVEGEVPKYVTTGERYRYLDASSLDGRLSLGIELDADPPSAFLGAWLVHADVQLDDDEASW